MVTPRVLGLSCVDDTDDIWAQAPPAPPVDEDWVLWLVGKWIEYAYELRNHRGYVDAFQLRLLNHDLRDEEIVQFEVAASTIEVRTVAVHR